MSCYNIVLRTSDSVSGDVDEYGDTDTASMTYAFDWSFIPDGDYELSYTFKTERYEDSVFALPHAISLPDFHFNSYSAGSKITAQTNSIIGVNEAVLVSETGTAASMAKHCSDNKPIFVRNPATFAQVFRVHLLGTDGVLQTSENVLSYMLILTLKKICSCDK